MSVEIGVNVEIDDLPAVSGGNGEQPVSGDRLLLSDGSGDFLLLSDGSGDNLLRSQ